MSGWITKINRDNQLLDLKNNHKYKLVLQIIFIRLFITDLKHTPKSFKSVGKGGGICARWKGFLLKQASLRLYS